MNRSLGVGVIACFFLSSFVLAQDRKRPNVVVILTDNHGAWTLGCYGNPDIRTPNIDRLADEGMLFTRAFASNPVCSPTRATLLTGLVPSQHGVHSFLAGGRLQTGPNARCTLDEFTSLPEVLRDQGYACGLVGKWHLGGNMHPQEGLNDEWITMPHGGTSTFYGAQVIDRGEIRTEPSYLTDFWTRNAVNFIDQHAKDDKPFFLFLAYNGPYALSRLLLREGRNRHAEYYADKDILSFPRVQPHPWQLNNRDYQNNPVSIRRVATEVSGVDDGVGEVIASLKNHGLDENTVVVFLADQGWVGGQGGFFGMGDHTRPLTARDGMMQIPLIWRHPNQIRDGVRSDQMIANYDVMPTLLGHLGIEEEMPQQPKSPGTDFSGLLAGNTSQSPPNRQDAIFYEFENLRCIRTETHKYVHRHPNGPHELFDLVADPNEFTNLVKAESHQSIRDELKRRLDEFYSEFSLPQYNLWEGGISQVRIHDGIDEELAQKTRVDVPKLTLGFKPALINVPEGYVVDLVAGPPLITHPTMACFDDSGSLYVCNNAGVNLSNDELEERLPNSIRKLVDQDADGRFDSFTIFADKMTFPMGGAWHDGSLYVASPPNIWKLTDSNGDGVADQRQVIVTQFGYSGNAASIHGCFFGPDGRLYWTDGYHGHEFRDQDGEITSQREGSYIFSCLPDGSDTRIHCGGGMDNPVELDFTDSGDMLGTVNILYHRPRVDALVHWLHGGAYPHREKVLDEIKITGDLLGPVHRFGHVAVSGMTRYRSGVLDHRFADDLFVTFFNSGKVVRLETQRNGSTYTATQHEFLSSSSRDFRPTDVLEDADGSLLVIDTGGWFYRGCPTSQFAKPDLQGGIYRVRRQGMTPMVDPRGLRIDWTKKSHPELFRLVNDTRFTVREQAVAELVRRGEPAITAIKSRVAHGDTRVRQNCILALTRIAQQDKLAIPACDAMRPALQDAVPKLRQLACRSLGTAAGGRGRKSSFTSLPCEWLVPLLQDQDAGVRRAAATAIGKLGAVGDPIEPNAAELVPPLFAALGRDEMDRSEEHAIVFALIEIGDVQAIRLSMQGLTSKPADMRRWRAAVTAIDQIDEAQIDFDQLKIALKSSERKTLLVAARIAKQRPEWASRIAEIVRDWVQNVGATERESHIELFLSSFLGHAPIDEVAGDILQGEDFSEHLKSLVVRSIAAADQVAPPESWINPLRGRLQSSDDTISSAAIRAVKSLSGNRFQDQLTAIADDDGRHIAIRIGALSVLVRQSGKLSDADFARLIDLYQNSGSPSAARQAAQILGSSKLVAQQRTNLIPLIQKASPGALRDLMRAFHGRIDTQTANAFLNSVASSDALLSVPEHELSDAVKRFPPESLGKANQILDRLKAHQQQKVKRLEGLLGRLADGDATNGEKVFAGEKSKCSTCHRVGEIGKPVGPDLTTIGRNRSASDLLESIVFPSASIVRDFEAHKVLTVDGRAMVGLIVSETSDSIELQQPSGEREKLNQEDIEQIIPSAVSIMPAGLDEALSEQELLDVVQFLQRAK